ncbi:MAG: AAA family ATPase [Pirellulaceae bacterium]|nr:AAA family ATPase [Pirellulaceae bacterium]
MPDSSVNVNSNRRSTTKAALPLTPKCKTGGKTFATARDAVSELERQHGPRSALWTYHNAHDEPVGVVVRWDLADGKKDIRPASMYGDGWRIGGMPEPRPLYCLPDLAGANRVFVCEGEKAADAVRDLGLVATTSPHECQSAGKANWGPLAGKEVIILPDNDPPGAGYADTVTGILAKLTPAPVVKLLKLPSLPDRGDAVDWLDAQPGVDRDDLRRQLEALADGADENSIPAPLESKLAGIEFRPVPASQLGDGEQIEWIWYGWLAVGYVMLLVGLWKAGKTTLLAHLLRAFRTGGDIAGQVTPCRVLFIAEEGAGLWARRRDDLGIGDNVHFLIRPFKGRPTPREWRQFVDRVAVYVKEGGFQLVVIDTWQAANPAQDENDASAMMAALTPLHAITEAGAAVLLAHHPRKGDASEAQASRGSGALPGFVDIIAELRRFDASIADDRRRRLRGHSRFDETPSEIVLELRDDGYHVIGSTADAKRSDRWTVIADLLAGAAVGLTVEQVRDKWPEDSGIPQPGLRTLRDDLNAGHDGGWWGRSGAGRKGDPYHYQFDSGKAPPLIAGSENDGREQTIL